MQEILYESSYHMHYSIPSRHEQIVWPVISITPSHEAQQGKLRIAPNYYKESSATIQSEP